MVVFWKSLLVFHVLISFPAIYRCTSQECFDAPISFHEKFNFDQILVQFLGNERLVLDISTIKFFFIFPNNFHCENVRVGESILPLFFIESTKNHFLLFFKDLFEINEDGFLQLGKKHEIRITFINDIINLKKSLQASFVNVSNIQDIANVLKQIVISSQSKIDVFDSQESVQSASTKWVSNDFISKIGELKAESANTVYWLEDQNFRMRYIIPAITIGNIHFIPGTNRNLRQNASNKYLKYDASSSFSSLLKFLGDGNSGKCYQVALQISTQSFDESFTLKFSSREKTFDYHVYFDEITVFSHVPSENQDGFCRPSAAVFHDDGKCAGFLMKFAEFGDLKYFIKNNHIEDYSYFYSQLLNVAKSIKIFHQNGVCHRDLFLGNIFVSKKKNAEERNAYYFQLGDFGKACVPHFSGCSLYLYKDKQETTSIYEECLCGKLFAEDFLKYSSLLPGILTYIFDRIVKTKYEKLGLNLTDWMSRKSIKLTVTLKSDNFDTIQNYFTQLMSIKSNSNIKISDFSSKQEFVFTNIADNFVTIFHSPDNISDNYVNGSTLIFDSSFEYELFSNDIVGSELEIYRIKDIINPPKKVEPSLNVEPLKAEDDAQLKSFPYDSQKVCERCGYCNPRYPKSRRDRPVDRYYDSHFSSDDDSQNVCERYGYYNPRYPKSRRDRPVDRYYDSHFSSDDDSQNVCERCGYCNPRYPKSRRDRPVDRYYDSHFSSDDDSQNVCERYGYYNPRYPKSRRDRDRPMNNGYNSSHSRDNNSQKKSENCNTNRRKKPS